MFPDTFSLLIPLKNIGSGNLRLPQFFVQGIGKDNEKVLVGHFKIGKQKIKSNKRTGNKPYKKLENKPVTIQFIVQLKMDKTIDINKIKYKGDNTVIDAKM